MSRPDSAGTEASGTALDGARAVLATRGVPSLLRAALEHRGPRRGTLVIQPLPGIGDMIWHLPHLHAIAAADPDGVVSVLTKPRSLAGRLLAADPAVERVLWLERNPGRHDGMLGLVRLAAMLRRERFARAWVLHGSSRYQLATLLAGIPQTTGYGRGRALGCLSAPVELSRDLMRRHPIEKADALLERCLPGRVARAPRLAVESATRERLRAEFAAMPAPWIGIGIGASEPAKQWGEQRFVELVRALVREHRASVFLLGGEAEGALAAAVVAATAAAAPGGAQVIPVIDRAIDEVAALLAECRLYVGNDTGVLNIAAAVGIDAVGLFGSSLPLTFSGAITCVVPPGLDPAARVGWGVFADAGTARGMERIELDQVLAAVRGLGAL